MVVFLRPQPVNWKYDYNKLYIEELIAAKEVRIGKNKALKREDMFIFKLTKRGYKLYTEPLHVGQGFKYYQSGMNSSLIAGTNEFDYNIMQLGIVS